MSTTAAPVNTVDMGTTTLAALIAACKTAGLKGYSGKKKEELIKMLETTRTPSSSKETKETTETKETKETKETTVPIRYADLFCGLGAFHTAFSSDKFKCVAACDIDEGARRIYKANYGLEPHGDIRTLDLEKMPEIDILCAGFPCFVAGTNVLTQDGYKPIENVAITDKLMTHTGDFQRILNLQRKTGTPALRTIGVAGRTQPIQCTEEHPFYVRTRESTPFWLPARDITNEQYVGMPINAENVERAEGCERELLELDEPIPEWVQAASPSFIQHYLAEFHKVNDVQKASIGTLLGVQRLYLKLGKACTTNGTELDAVAAFIDAGYAWFKVDSTTDHVGEPQTVYNFEVEHDNSYCVENTIVHNCQPFSIAGNGEGFKDTVKGNLFYDILNILDKKKPPMCILENVKNLKTHDKGNTYKTIVAELEKRAYRVTSKVINASEYGSPQARHRIFIVATKGEKPFTIPEGTGTINAVRTILDPTITKDELNRAKYTVVEKGEKVVKPGKPHILYDLFPIYSEKKKAAIAAKKETTEDEEPKGGRQGERVYSVDAVGITVCASSGGPGAKTGLYKVGDAIRRLSVKETLKMFGFPETYAFPDTSPEDCLFYLGNSIVVDVPRALVPAVEAWFAP